MATLPDGMNWLMRPVDMGYCQMESLKNGSLDLEDVALMNDAIDVRLENERRVRRANNRG